MIVEKSAVNWEIFCIPFLAERWSMSFTRQDWSTGGGGGNILFQGMGQVSGRDGQRTTTAWVRWLPVPFPRCLYLRCPRMISMSMKKLFQTPYANGIFCWFNQERGIFSLYIVTDRDRMSTRPNDLQQLIYTHFQKGVSETFHISTDMVFQNQHLSLCPRPTCR